MRNAYSGYSYHDHIATMFIAIMDVERKIVKIEIEAITPDKFDDVMLHLPDEIIQIQIKDFAEVKSVAVVHKGIVINGDSYPLSTNTNVVFFSRYDYQSNSQVLGFPSYLLDGVHLVSLNREETDECINELYQNDYRRKVAIYEYFNKIKDDRIWQIRKEELPSLDIYNTDLLEETVDVGLNLLHDHQLLLVEGKPGVGKSHYVTLISQHYFGHILYRFWTSNQDPHYQERLKFNNFIQDVSKQIFSDRIDRSVDAVLHGLKERQTVLIIDGLDHIENYQAGDLSKYISFIEEASKICKIIVFSRPLVEQLPWNKQVLENWTSSQTSAVLENLFGLDDYLIKQKIFEITQGYPILVKFLAEHYKQHFELPQLDKIGSIDTYYEQILKKEKSKRALLLFLCTKSFLMVSELQLFLGAEAPYVEEFIRYYPYLFERRLNRVSLIHDSLTTYLHKFGSGYQELSKKVSQIVMASVTSFENRFLSRFALFDISLEDRQIVLKLYAWISSYRRIIDGCIDVESVRTFYEQLKLILSESDSGVLDIVQYYDLALIENLIVRDHFSAQFDFYYVYVKVLLDHGYTSEDVTSSAYLFGMMYYYETNNPLFLAREKDLDTFNSNHFFSDFEAQIENERRYFIDYSQPLTDKRVSKALSKKGDFRKKLTYILTNTYIHDLKYNVNAILSDATSFLKDGDQERTKFIIEQYVEANGEQAYKGTWIFNDVKKLLRNLGYSIKGEDNELLTLTLEELIEKHKALGSFDLFELVHNYLRLAAHQNRTIDVNNIFHFYSKYYNRRDYSLFSTPSALYTLERRELLHRKKCVDIISHMQNISEKEFRGLLIDFISYYSPEDIIPFLEDNFEIEDLIIDWFLLKPIYIDQFSIALFNKAIRKLLDENRFTQELDLRDCKYVLDSKWSSQFGEILRVTGFRLRLPEKSPMAARLTKVKIPLIVDKSNNDQSYSLDKIRKWDRGVLDPDDLDYIIEKDIPITKLATYLDEHGSSLMSSLVFSQYPVSLVKQNLHQILFNAMTARTVSGLFYSALYFWPGTVLEMLSVYGRTADFVSAAESYKVFMKLSKFDI